MSLINLARYLYNDQGFNFGSVHALNLSSFYHLGSLDCTIVAVLTEFTWRSGDSRHFKWLGTDNFVGTAKADRLCLPVCRQNTSPTNLQHNSVLKI